MHLSKILFNLLFVFGITALTYATTRVNIVCGEADATLLVNGKKKGVLHDKVTAIVLPIGKYELMVTKPLDEDWRMVGRKNIELRDEKVRSVDLSLDIEKISKKKNTSTVDNFRKSGNVVIDKSRKLIWQDTPSVIEVQKNWEDAKSYCQALSLEHGEDWRLPSYDELISIVDYTKYTLAIMPMFEHIVSEYYWSSNEDTENSQNVKNIYFGNGCPDEKPKKEKYFIRCVRPLK